MEMKMEQYLFGSIFQQKIDTGETLKFSLTPLTICLTHIDGSMQVTPILILVQLVTRSSFDV